MNNNIVPDCLVLKLEEIDAKNVNAIDTTIYILYDTKKLKYIIRGKRRQTIKYNSCTYSFECNLKNNLVHFLKYIICESTVVNETLFNYDDLPKDSNKITFEYLQEFENRNNEISGYDKKKLTKKRLTKNLTILESISNYF